MSAVEPSVSSPKWYENKTFLTASALTGLVLGMLSLGVIVAATGTSSHWYYANGTSPGLPFMPQSKEIAQTCMYGGKIGTIAVAPCVLGFMLFASSLLELYRMHQKQISTTEVQPPPCDGEAKAIQWKNIAFVVGLAIGAFSAGLVIGSSTILSNGVSRMEDLITQGRHDYPNASIVDYNNDPTEVGTWHNCWDRLQEKWLDPTKTNMNGILTAGVFGGLGGGALCATALLGRGIFACYSRCKKSKPVEASS